MRLIGNRGPRSEAEIEADIERRERGNQQRFSLSAAENQRNRELLEAAWRAGEAERQMEAARQLERDQLRAQREQEQLIATERYEQQLIEAEQADQERIRKRIEAAFQQKLLEQELEAERQREIERLRAEAPFVKAELDAKSRQQFIDRVLANRQENEARIQRLWDAYERGQAERQKLRGRR